MSINAHLTFEGIEIKGESPIDKHEDEIQILSWEWGMTQSGTVHNGSGFGAGKVNVQDVIINKRIDASTPDLMKFCCNGAPIKKAIISLEKAGGDKPLDYVVIELDKVMITSVEVVGEKEAEIVKERITLNFAQYKITYKKQSTDTGASEAEYEAGWNITANKAA